MHEALIAQPALGSETLELFSRATFELLKDPSGADLDEHLCRLGMLTRSDLVMLYASRPDQNAFALTAVHGLPTRLLGRFATVGADRALLNSDLQALGMRGCWAGDVVLEGLHLGTLFFASRRWHLAHSDTGAIISATCRQLAWVLAERRKTGGRSAAAMPGQAESQVGDRDHFIALLAHELRNPVAPIRSGLDLLTTGKPGEAVRSETLAMMQRQMAHLVRLMDDLLDTARLSTGRLPIKPEPVRLSEVFHTAIESVRPALLVKHQTLQVCGTAGEAVVLADPVRLCQAFANILGGNIQQTLPNGTITIDGTVTQGVAVLTFSGDGAEPVSPALEPDNGLGLGIALVRGLIELNGGTVEVKRREHNGSVLNVTLPLTQQLPAAVDDAPDGQAAVGGIRQRVLIVDDNQDAAQILGLLFELDGYAIRLAHDGPSAVAEAAAFDPDIILMDMGLPGFDGVEAVRRIRARQGALRPCIVALTGWGAPADRTASRDAGVDLHLVKPMAYPELTAAIASLGHAATEPAADTAPIGIPRD